MSNGKGSVPRPHDAAAFRSGWERTFGPCYVTVPTPAPLSPIEDIIFRGDPPYLTDCDPGDEKQPGDWLRWVIGSTPSIMSRQAREEFRARLFHALGAPQGGTHACP
jgi:hypothetical protein